MGTGDDDGATGSLWFDTLGSPAETDGPLTGATAADVVVVGAGFTGLWTAYEIARRDPGRRVMVLEAESVGFGASGRNGGWCSAILPVSLSALARRHDRAAAIALQRAMHDTVAHVADTVEQEGIDCGFERGGTVTLARTAPQVRRLHLHLEEMAEFGFGEEHHRWLSAETAMGMVAATGVRGGVFTPHCATVHPARLVHGLARAARARGVVLHDRTPVRAIEPGRVETRVGTVMARHVVRATEAWTSGFPGHRRDSIPVYSLMIATEPLDDAHWAEIGLQDRPTFDDGRRLVVYGQRTADGRLAFGGRGAPYHLGSRIRPRYDSHPAVHESLHRALLDLFPSLAGVRITHRWGGPLAIPRDWHPSVGLDRETGIAWAGGYVGDGVAAANLAGRTVADLVTGQDTDLTRLAWVGHRSPRWEPEPIRWLAVNAAVTLTGSIDAAERRSGRPARLRSRLLDRITGH